MLELKSIHVSKMGSRSVHDDNDHNMIKSDFVFFFLQKYITSLFHTDNKCLSNLPESFWVQLNSHISYWEYLLNW